MDILKRINQLRINKNWSVYRLSVEAGLPQSTLTNMINRETLPSIVTLEAICDALGITMSDFFNEENCNTQIDYEEFLEIYNKLPNDTKVSILNLMKNIADTL